MKKILVLIIGFLILFSNHVWAQQQNPLADPSLIETTTQPPVLSGPGATAVTTVVFTNAGFDMIPAHTIRITISLNQYLHYVSPNDITGFEVFFVTADNSAVTLENTVAFPGGNFTLYQLRINTVAVLPTPAPSPYVATVFRIPAQASQVGNLNIANDNVSGAIVVSAGVALPLSLLSFTGISNDCNTQLHWKTSNEINTKSFEVEHSKDGVHFSFLQKVNAKGNGDNSYLIQIPQTVKTTHYRLAMVDHDNTKRYSQIINVRSNCDINGSFSVYPNPAEKNAPVVLQSSLEELITYKVFDVSGKLLRRGNFQSRTELNNLGAGGTYFIEFLSSSQSKKFKVVIQ